MSSVNQFTAANILLTSGYAYYNRPSQNYPTAEEYRLNPGRREEAKQQVSAQLASEKSGFKSNSCKAIASYVAAIVSFIASGLFIAYGMSNMENTGRIGFLAIPGALISIGSLVASAIAEQYYCHQSTKSAVNTMDLTQREREYERIDNWS